MGKVERDLGLEACGLSLKGRLMASGVMFNYSCMYSKYLRHWNRTSKPAISTKRLHSFKKRLEIYRFKIRTVRNRRPLKIAKKASPFPDGFRTSCIFIGLGDFSFDWPLSLLTNRVDLPRLKSKN